MTSSKEAKQREIYERRLHIQRMMKDGLSPKEIAAHLGLNHHTVLSGISKARKLGWDMPYSRRTRTEKEREAENDKIIELFERGMEPKDVATELQMKPGTLSCRVDQLEESRGWCMPSKRQRRVIRKNREARGTE